MNMTGDTWISGVKFIPSIPKALGFIPKTRQRKNDIKKVMSRKLDIPLSEDDI